MRALLLIAATAVMLAGAPVRAYWWSGAGIGVGGLYRSLDYPSDRRVPYFAAHPPVYYSHPVPRTYGHSPFAYPPTHRTPDVIPYVQPVEIINPYVVPADEAATKTKKTRSTRAKTIANPAERPAAEPVTIINPFVTPAKTI